jgi:hypothetical protein
MLDNLRLTTFAHMANAQEVKTLSQRRPLCLENKSDAKKADFKVSKYQIQGNVPRLT